MNNYFNITDSLNEETLLEFLEHKKNSYNPDITEINSIQEYIDSGRYILMKEKLVNGTFPNELAKRKIINKDGSKKKRVIYSYSNDINITLKFIAYKLHKFDYLFSDNCYSFRINYGVSNAIRKIRRNKHIKEQYCLKVDIKNYFNSMNTDILLHKLEFLKKSELHIYNAFKNILSEEHVCSDGKIISDAHGGMAGIPVSPFFANIYMSEIDDYFNKNNIEYYRYSDDIIIFSDSYSELIDIKNRLYDMIGNLELDINPEKESISKPGETWEFLGFAYKNGKIDLSENTIRKMKHKIKRKSNALRRWQRKKGLNSEKAAIGFIKAINRKLYGRENINNPDILNSNCYSNNDNCLADNNILNDSIQSDVYLDSSDFTWCRWFFPNITSTTGLKIIDQYIQEYMRYTITGRHYKGNYRIKYDTLKKLGYRNLVHEYYASKKIDK